MCLYPLRMAISTYKPPQLAPKLPRNRRKIITAFSTSLGFESHVPRPIWGSFAPVESVTMLPKDILGVRAVRGGDRRMQGKISRPSRPLWLYRLLSLRGCIIERGPAGGPDRSGIPAPRESRSRSAVVNSPAGGLSRTGGADRWRRKPVDNIRSSQSCWFTTTRGREPSWTLGNGAEGVEEDPSGLGSEDPAYRPAHVKHDLCRGNSQREIPHVTDHLTLTRDDTTCGKSVGSSEFQIVQTPSSP